ncbi:hypothetical protein [Nonomuraea candida]|uniref:hypothetical protein n=1 Tax=Nonomuraea candida TaxID=359159 RepID=UPI0006934CAB|nr:hypothetical protein [Nonomuraea candida]
MTFKDKLLLELRAEATKVTWEPVPAHPSRRYVLAGAGLVVVAAAAMVVTSMPLLPSTPAFAVEKNSDGTVTVRIHELIESEELEKRLAEAGVKAVIDYLPDGQQCQMDRGEIVPAPVNPLQRTADYGTWLIDPKSLAPDETLLIRMSFKDNDPAKGFGGGVGKIRGPVAPCVPVPMGTRGPDGGGPVS